MIQVPPQATKQEKGHTEVCNSYITPPRIFNQLPISKIKPPDLGSRFLYLLAQFVIIWLPFSACKAAKEKDLEEELPGLQDWGLSPPNPIPKAS